MFLRGSMSSKTVLLYTFHEVLNIIIFQRKWPKVMNKYNGQTKHSWKSIYLRVLPNVDVDVGYQRFYHPNPGTLCLPKVAVLPFQGTSWHLFTTLPLFTLRSVQLNPKENVAATEGSNEPTFWIPANGLNAFRSCRVEWTSFPFMLVEIFGI